MLPIVTSLDEILSSTDSHKLYIVRKSDTDAIQTMLISKGIKPVNLGYELASFVKSLDSDEHISIEAEDFARRFFDEKKVKAGNSANYIVAIYNIGILLEATLSIKAASLLSKISKSVAIIILWDGKDPETAILDWNDRSRYYLDFSDVQIKLFQNAL